MSAYHSAYNPSMAKRYEEAFTLFCVCMYVCVTALITYLDCVQSDNKDIMRVNNINSQE